MIAWNGCVTISSNQTYKKQAMTAFTHALHDSRYTAVFAEHVSNMDNLSLTDPISNTTIQYVSAIMPAKETPQLVKRMPC